MKATGRAGFKPAPTGEVALRREKGGEDRLLRM